MSQIKTNVFQKDVQGLDSNDEWHRAKIDEMADLTKDLVNDLSMYVGVALGMREGDKVSFCFSTIHYIVVLEFDAQRNLSADRRSNFPTLCWPVGFIWFRILASNRSDVGRLFRRRFFCWKNLKVF